MFLLRSSTMERDPLSDVLEVLGAQVVRRTRMEAGGPWAFAFPTANRLKFVAVLEGEQWILTANEPHCLMKKGDVCLLGRTSYVVASDPELEPQNGTLLFPEGGSDVARVGSGDGVVAIGGSIAFSDENGDFLLDLLPGFLLVGREASASGAIAAVLNLITKEILRGAMGTGIVAARLADVLVVEALRTLSDDGDRSLTGWLGSTSRSRVTRSPPRRRITVDSCRVGGSGRHVASCVFCEIQPTGWETTSSLSPLLAAHPRKNNVA
ncbi:cupin domain-containing protein [Agrobacterium rosae]|uniref:cupin domain-containing protein n=2 Tax=Agrobacterium rosae TaxID=1972867 RepID=UPI003B9F7F92